MCQYKRFLICIEINHSVFAETKGGSALLINALPPKFLQKRFPPIFSMVHLLHRLYGVDAPMCPVCAEEYDTSLHLLGRCSALVAK